ncbi:sensor histidine kinase KdpD [Paraburkholderia sp. A1RI-2L]|uniref:DUF4118 domain-containing protein n=1 Tax=Paraburkholderia sp. A1RI-2L TaxID=3028367 RepID=UPI003B7696F3
MNRPDPDELLDRLQRDEEKRRRGKLKIFFGASAGVGKTYAMLQAARRRQEEGMDVVVGIVETHGRSETAALTSGLEELPRQRIAYRGRMLEEFDLDAALGRKPQLVLVDELAHSNVQGARHMKRWQDVYELLDAGIDVYTTVNVQHLESLNDVVGQITGIRVWETVPDRVFDGADEVTLVDLPAEELLDRMRDGKVYMPAQAERAVRNFFRKGNLIALRELALRRTADRVDAQMHEYRADRSIQHVWQARERLLVCVGPGPEASALVRASARLAASLKADWIAVYVETPRLQRLPDEVRQRTLGALKLASELGAETATLAGEDAAVTLAGYARLRNVSKLVAGVSARSGASWWRWLRRPFGERLAEKAEGADLTWCARAPPITTGSRARSVRRRPRRAANAWRAAIASGTANRSPPRAYAAALLICASITVLASTVMDRIALANLVMLYLLGVIFTATKLGRGPGVLLSFASVAAYDFFFVPPRLSFSVSDTQYLLTFVGMLLTSLVISHLTSSLRREASVAQRREQRTGAMYAMARELAAALATEQIVAIGSRHVSEVFGARVAILLPDSADKVQQKIEDPDPQIMLEPGSLDIDVGQWVYDQQKPAGRGTDTLPAAAALYLPLKAPMRTRGVLAVVTRDAREMQVPEQQRMLDAFAAQIALALERVHYVEIARDALVNMESERLRNSLLSAISHDLRTPLTAIVGFSSMLAQAHESDAAGTPADARNARSGELIEAIHDEALRMTGIVTNLLDMARLQAGSLKLNRQWTLLEETVGAALAACRRVLARHPVQVQLEAGLPLLQLDAVLMERLFSNLLENAAKYTPPDTPLTISARRIEENGQPFVRVSIDDAGQGLPHGMGERVFEKFTRGEKESAKPGIGLGLAICRAIVEAHDGTIGATNRLAADGHVEGASFWFALPVQTPPPLPTDEPADLKPAHE